MASPIGAGRGCFLAGNEVKTNMGNVCIEDMKRVVFYNKNIRVLTHDGNYRAVEIFCLQCKQ